MPNQKKKSRQTTYGYGGARPGAGRKPKNPEGPGVSHARRPLLASRFPVHVSLKVREGLPDLRGPQLRNLILTHLSKGQKRKGFRLVHFSIQSSSLHFLVEAVDARALSAGIQGIAIRLAKQINKELGITGRVFADRFSERVLKTPTQTRKALAYVINNLRRQKAQQGKELARDWIDPLSSGPRFDGWKDAPAKSSPSEQDQEITTLVSDEHIQEKIELVCDEQIQEGAELVSDEKIQEDAKLVSDGHIQEEEELVSDEPNQKPIGVPPNTWLLRTGWKLRGLLSVNDVPDDAGIPTGRSKANPR